MFDRYLQRKKSYFFLIILTFVMKIVLLRGGKQGGGGGYQRGAIIKANTVVNITRFIPYDGESLLFPINKQKLFGHDSTRKRLNLAFFPKARPHSLRLLNLPFWAKSILRQTAISDFLLTIEPIKKIFSPSLLISMKCKI